MKKILVTILFFLVGFSSESYSQKTPKMDKDKAINGRFIGFNANPMLNLVIPFSVFPVNIPAPIFTFRRMFDGHGFVTNFGVLAEKNNEFFFSFPEFAVYASFGYNYKRPLHKDFYWNFGSSLKSVVDDRSPNFDFFFGLALHYGIEYHINPVISFSTEASIDFGTDDFDVMIRTNPPIQITAHFNLSKQKK
jgi:hypothetical protein